MDTLWTARRTLVQLGPELGRGGEGAIYELPDTPEQVAKVYTLPAGDRRRAVCQAKVEWMVVNPPPTPAGAAAVPDQFRLAWPVETLYDGAGRFAGFVMPKADGITLFRLYNPKERSRAAPGATRKTLHQTAYRLAAAVDFVHGGGYAIGDVNEGNALVVPEKALVTIIDTDSFQVVEMRGGTRHVYRCLVGKPDFTPPELQGARFPDVDRSAEHDRFGLAVLLFMLLMEGNHPFRALWRGSGDPPVIGERIRLGYFPWAATPSAVVAVPPGVPPFADLFPPLQVLFRSCFDAGHRDPGQRPPAAAWVKTLEAAEADLVRCTVNTAHYHASHVQACPECAREETARNAEHQRERVQRSPAWSWFPQPAPMPPVAAPPVAPAPPPRPVPRWVQLVVVTALAVNVVAGALAAGGGPTAAPSWPGNATAAAARLQAVAAARKERLERLDAGRAERRGAPTPLASKMSRVAVHG